MLDTSVISAQKISETVARFVHKDSTATQEQQCPPGVPIHSTGEVLELLISHTADHVLLVTTASRTIQSSECVLRAISVLTKLWNLFLARRELTTPGSVLSMEIAASSAQSVQAVTKEE